MVKSFEQKNPFEPFQALLENINVGNSERLKLKCVRGFNFVCLIIANKRVLV